MTSGVTCMTTDLQTESKPEMRFSLSADAANELVNAMNRNVPHQRSKGGYPDPTSIHNLIPARSTIRELRESAKGCRACDLWKNATQTVFGEGAGGADIMLIGEQPGDQEDRSGHPFVGPAGKLLDQALAEAGVERSDVYVTNVVKHFKWSGERGKRRIHKKPNS